MSAREMDEVPAHVLATRLERRRVAQLLGRVAGEVAIPGIRGGSWSISTLHPSRISATRHFQFDDTTRRGASSGHRLVTAKSPDPSALRPQDLADVIALLNGLVDIDASGACEAYIRVDGRQCPAWAVPGRYAITVSAALGGAIAWISPEGEQPLHAVRSVELPTHHARTS